MQVVDSTHLEAVPSEHKRPVARARTDIADGPTARGLPDEFQGLVARHDTSEMVHEDREHSVRRPDEAGLRRGPPPFEVLAGPEPEVEVGVEVRSLALGDAGGEDGGVGFDVCCRWVA